MDFTILFLSWLDNSISISRSKRNGPFIDFRRSLMPSNVNRFPNCILNDITAQHLGLTSEQEKPRLQLLSQSLFFCFFVRYFYLCSYDSTSMSLCFPPSLFISLYLSLAPSLSLSLSLSVVYKCFLRKLLQLRRTDVTSFCVQLEKIDVGYCGELSVVRERGLTAVSAGVKKEKMMSSRCIIARAVSAKKHLYTTLSLSLSIYLCLACV